MRAAVLRDEIVRAPGERGTEELAPRAFRRAAPEVRLAQQLRERALIDLSTGRAVPVDVVRRAGHRGDAVDDHVPRACVERDDVAGAGGWDEREIRDASDVQHRDGREVREEDHVGEWDEWRALTTRGDVGAAEVRGRRHAGARRDTRRVADLKRDVLIGQVGDRLTVDRDHVGTLAKTLDHALGEVGVRVAEEAVEARDLARVGGATLAQREDGVADAPRIRRRRGREDANAARSDRDIELDRGRVDAVARGPRHHADRDHV